MSRRPLLFSCLLHFLSAVYCLLSTPSFSQDYLGFANSSFAGVNGIDVNPAFIVNSPRKWDVTIVGLNFAFGNNFMGLQKKALQHTGSTFTGDYPAFNDENFLNNYVTQDSKGKPISVFVGANIMLPSFMFTRPKHKDAFGFTCRSRVYVNVDGIDPNLAHMIINGENDSARFNQDFPSLGLSVQSMLWNEYGITYGKTISQTSNERLNVAGRLKLLQGLYSMYLFIEDVVYRFYEVDSILIESPKVGYGHSTNLEFSPDAAKFGFGGKPSFGLDLGATYEFHALTDVRSRGKSEPKTSPLQHEYKYKLGFSIQDLGWIKFLKPENARDFTADINGNLDLASLQSSGTTPLADADDTLAKKFPMNPGDTKYRMNLPTLLSVQGDYYAGKNVYVNSTLNYAFQFKKNKNKIHEVTTFSITPRWDWKWLGAYLPLSYNKYSGIRTGFSLRLGPLIVGTADLLPVLSKRDIRGLDFHFLLKVPHIRFGKKDKSPRSRSKFDVNREKTKKPKRQKTGKSDMPKKDQASYEKPRKKKKERTMAEVNREQKSRKHLFPRLNFFKKKRNQKMQKGVEKTIYFKL